MEWWFALGYTYVCFSVGTFALTLTVGLICEAWRGHYPGEVETDEC